MSNGDRVVSGVQASGLLHLGNYLGAINNWHKLQDQQDCFFFIADLHAITVDQDPKILLDNVYNTLSTYLACGIEPEKVTMFVQSQVPAHAELAWILNCHAPIGWLNRMTQFKSKAAQNIEFSSAGLFTYPILMAADILLYDAAQVPVGDDQKQHLEFTRDLAELLNRKFNEEIFIVPQPLISKSSPRIMSLKDGNNKMSKSELSDQSRINLNDDESSIVAKIRKAKTDSISKMSYEPGIRKEMTNLINIYSTISGDSIDKIVGKYQGNNLSQFKKDLSEIVTELVSPISQKIKQYNNNRDYLDTIIKIGADKANMIAMPKIELVKRKQGFIA